MADDQHYDVVIIGTGAGGGTLGHRLATSGAKVLWLERGPFLPRERDNWADRGGVRPRQVPRAGGLVRPARPRVPARGQLLRRREHQVLRRGAVPAAPGGLRRAAPPRWDLAGLADLLRRPGALLHPGRAPLPGARPARRGPDRGPGQRAVRLPAGVPRTAHPAAQRRPGEARAAPLPPADRSQPRRRRSRAARPGRACASAATGSTASRACWTPSRTRRSSAWIRCCPRTTSRW